MQTQAPSRTVEPSLSLLTLEGVKEHLRVLDEDSDSLIEGLIEAVTAHLDGYTGILGRALLPQTWAMKIGAFPSCGMIRIPLGPVIGTPTISYYNTAGTVQSFSSFYLVADAIGPAIVLHDTANWPSTFTRPDAATLTWQCGYADADAVPAAIKQAALLMIGHWFANREAVAAPQAELPLTVSALLAPYRSVGL